MKATVEQTRNELGRLIRLAARGEEVLITEEGQPVAKLVGINPPKLPTDRAKWLESLRELRSAVATGRSGRSSDEILDEDRSGRQ